MGSLVILFALLSLIGVCKADPGCPGLDTYYWGYWGANLTETSAPDIIWDTEDANQLTLAYNNNKAVLFKLQNLLFDFDGPTNMFSAKSNWANLIDTNYGNYSNPTNPYSISGLYANSPNGFFIGSNLMWYGLEPSKLYTIANYLRAKYPTALIAIDEHFSLYYNGRNFHNEDYVFWVYNPINILSISHYWPDGIDGVPDGTTTSNNIYYEYKDFILPSLKDDVKMVWSIAMYDTSPTYMESSCHPPSGEDCAFVMKNRTAEFFQMMCRDRANCDEADPLPNYIHSDRIRGIWAWHWDNRPNTVGYETGLRSIPELHGYEFYFGTLACDLNPASIVSLSAYTLLLVLFLFI